MFNFIYEHWINVFDTIAEQIFITDVFDTSLNIPDIIYVHDFAYTQNKIRSTTSITSVVNLPANSVLNNNFVYIQLPASLDSSLFYSPTVSCSVKRVNDPSLAEFVKACNLLRGRKVVIHLNTDILNNVNLNYTITLSNILTPQQPSSVSTWFREDIKVFIAPDNQTVTYTSAPGNRNTTTYMNWIVDSNVILLNWLNNQNSGFSSFQNFLDVNTGHYATNPAISVASGNFNNTFTWQFSGSNTSSFTSQQNPLISNALQIRTGYSTSRFFIAAKENVAPGKYYLSTIKNADTYNAYSPLPYIDIRVVQNTCLITPSFSSISIPAGGYSNPIVLNFQNCIPMTDVSVMANLTSGNNLYLTFANGQTTHSQGLKFESILGNYQIYFYLYSGNPNNNLTRGAATIAFSLSGTDAPFFSIAGGVSVNIIALKTDAPIPQSPSIISSPGNAIILFSCSHTGKIYYALGLKSSVNSIEIDRIKNLTENSLIRQTVPEKDDADYKILGYITYSQYDYQQVSVSNQLKEGENYRVISYCMNQMYVVGNSSASSSWIQPDNQGKTVALNFIFKNGALSSAQKLDLACGLARFFAIPPSRVKTDEGLSCPSLRVLQTSNTSATVNATTYNAYNWFIVKDYFSSSDSLYQDVQAKMRDSTFASQVLKLTSNGLTGFPVVNATSNQVIDAYTNLGAIVPTVLASTETSNWNSVAFSLSLTNVQGYVFAGIANQSVTLPTAQQIRLGVDGAGNPLINRLFSQLANNSNILFNFTNLQNTTNYTLFWFGSNLDTSINAVISPVGQRAVETCSLTYPYADDVTGRCYSVCPSPRWRLASSGKCENSCPSSFYSSLPSRECKPCDFSCETCSEGGSTNCLTCESGLTQLYHASPIVGATGSCLKECAISFPYADETTGRCYKICPPPREPDIPSNKCRNPKICPKNCQKCENVDSCSECLSGYYLKSTNYSNIYQTCESYCPETFSRRKIEESTSEVCEPCSLRKMDFLVPSPLFPGFHKKILFYIFSL